MPTEGINSTQEEEVFELDRFDERVESGPPEESRELEISEPTVDGVETDDVAIWTDTIDSGKQAVIDHKRGEADSWELHSRGESGHSFNGKEILDAEGNSWTEKVERQGQPDDIALHHEMLAQWREGGSCVFFLPDHVERTDDGEILYVTFLKLDEDGGVSYEIWAYETKYHEDDDAFLKPAGEDAETLDVSLWMETNENPSEMPAPEPFNMPLSVEYARNAMVEETDRAELSDESIPSTPHTDSSIEVAQNSFISEMPATDSYGRSELGEPGDSLNLLLQDLFKTELLAVPHAPEPDVMVSRFDPAGSRPHESVLDVPAAAVVEKRTAESSPHEPAPNVPSIITTVKVRAVEPPPRAFVPIIPTRESSAPMPDAREEPVYTTDIAEVITNELPKDVSHTIERAQDPVLDTFINRPIPPNTNEKTAPVGTSPERSKQVEIKTFEPVRNQSADSEQESRQTPVSVLKDGTVSAIRFAHKPAIETMQSAPGRVTEKEHRPLSANDPEFMNHHAKPERHIPLRGTEVLLRALGARVPSMPRSADIAYTLANPEILRTANSASLQYVAVPDAQPSGDVVHTLHGIRMRRTA